VDWRAKRADDSTSNASALSAPTISLPKGGGAIRGIGEKFVANPVTGTGSMTVPIATSPGRSGFGPQLSLSYDSGSGNGSFGFGWSLSLPAITRKTDNGLPRYRDAEQSDVFILSASEDLVPVLEADGKLYEDKTSVPGYIIHRYRPRIEGLFARIERWSRMDGDVHWRSISKDNILTLYGKDGESRIADPDDPRRIFSWLICETRDDKGNAVIYEYKSEDSARIDVTQLNERNRGALNTERRNVNRYIKNIKYGNRVSVLGANGLRPVFAAKADLEHAGWMFEVLFDYGDGRYEEALPDAEGRVFATTMLEPQAGSAWPARRDAFSSYRAAFEVRTYRLCRRVFMFHHFPHELGTLDYLVRSTDFEYSESPIASVIKQVTQSGYARQDDGSYLKRSLPPLEFGYTEATVHDEVRDVAAESLENLPCGLDGSNYQWVDLDGEGISGVLTEQAGAWFYKRNLSPNPRNVVKENGHERIEPEFAAVELVASQPAFALAGGAQFVDLAGDGQPDLAQFDGPVRGFYERTDDADWEPFRPFISWPNVDTRDPNLKFVDLDGDGHSDILITEQGVLAWYPSIAEEGFGPAQRVPTPSDEEQGPRVIFADGTQSIYLADMSGDGLTDLVRVRNGEVCYWPNLGYGSFGAKVTMDHSPWFDAPDQFDQKRIRFGDIDGSGTTDIIYLGAQGVRLYFNQSGNAWSDPRTLTQFPSINNISSVTAVDLLGNGTACLVWSSPLPGNGHTPMRYIDLMGGQKPHLLVSVANNLGAETKVQYAPSTKFYVADRCEGKPWITKLPFPVHVVERVETYDYVSRNRFVTCYTYHHGYFDGEEREFRGFGRVDQLDTEEFATLSQSGDFPTGDNIAAASHVPPVLTKTWFHTGAYLEEARISKHFEHEYYREGGESEADPGLPVEELEAMLLPDTVLPSTIKWQDGTWMPLDLSSDELREACRALKGSILRQELYGLDGSDAQDRPYSASERNYTIECLQPYGDNKHAVFFAHPRETVDFHYERKLYRVSDGAIVDTSAAPPANATLAADPRVSHAVTLAVDSFGNVLKSIAIGYGRRFDDFDPILTSADKQKQKQILLTYSENDYTNPILLNDAYRVPLPSEIRTYELTNISPDRTHSPVPASVSPRGRRQVTTLFRFQELQMKTATFDRDHNLSYEELKDESDVVPGDARPYRRIIERSRTLYRTNDLSAALAVGILESMALPYETYKLAFTSGLLPRVYQRPQSNATFESLLPDVPAVLEGDGGYVDLDGNGWWWIPSGRVSYSPQAADAAAQELAYARRHFFLPCRFQDPFRQSTMIVYDTNDVDLSKNNDVLIVGSRDPVGNTVRVQNDYRVLQPELLTEPNGNRSAVVFDAFGMVVAIAIMGKEQEPEGKPKGDSLDGIVADLSQQEIDTFFNAPDPHVRAPSLLKDATTRIIYDLGRFVRTRQAHPEDPTHWLPVYGATLARETHASDPPPSQGLKIQITFSYSDGLGRAIQKKIQAEPGPLVEGAPNVNTRWVGTGWTIFNNKGKAVRKYEPYFSATSDFDLARTVGVSPILFYDPLGRVVATLNPNHTYEKVVFDAWRQVTWDVNDTVLQADPKSDPDLGDFFRRLPDDYYLPSWYTLRKDGVLGAQEQAATNKSAVHADTPAVAYFDTLGRTFLTLAHNRFQSNGSTFDAKYSTVVNLDIEGNQREVIDAKHRIVMRYDYDMLSNRLHETSMEAGERWMLNDIAGKPIFSWDSRGYTLRTMYDGLRRPIEVHLREANGPELLVQRTVYGEVQPNPEGNNLRTKVYQAFDGAGVVTSDAYDFKGNLLRSRRQLAIDYKSTLDWSVTVALEGESYTTLMTYDALNRPVTLTTPDNSVIRDTYNEANALERIEGNLRGSVTVTSFVTNIDYDAKGQRTLIEYGNGVRTQYEYDPQTFRLTHVFTARGVAFPGDDPNPPQPPRGVQNLRYTYDPAGNITYIRDNAQQAIYFRNQRVEPSNEYAYDATYRLIEAAGREHLGQLAGGGTSPPTPTSDTDAPRIGLLHPGDGNAMGRYHQQYVYDEVGNIVKMSHAGTDPTNPGWTRDYKYEEVSLLEPTRTSNQLTSTQIGSDPPQSYTHDAHGNMSSMPHLQVIEWDVRDQLRVSAQQIVNGGAGERTYCVYDATGQRVRKVTERQNGTRRKERVYLGTFECYREYSGNGSAVALERETLHLMDDDRRIALIETRTKGSDSSQEQLIRYQCGNHLGSASLELDIQAQIVCYEEYYPYGGTSYQSVRSQTQAPTRYRYTGKERDEETALYYYGARSYIPWLGRWTATDPAGIRDGLNLYGYVRGNPIMLRDPDGKAPIPTVGPQSGPRLPLPSNLPAPRAVPFTPFEPPPPVTVPTPPPAALPAPPPAVVPTLAPTAVETLAPTATETLAPTLAETLGAVFVGLLAIGTVGYLLFKTDYSYRGESGASGVPPEPRDLGVEEPPVSAPGTPGNGPLDTPGQAGIQQVDAPGARPAQPATAPGGQPIIPTRLPGDKPVVPVKAIQGFHGAKAEEILSIIETGTLKPKAGRIFIGGSAEETFAHGADRSRRAAFSLEVRTTKLVDANVERTRTPGVPTTTIINTKTPQKIEIGSLHVRTLHRDEEGRRVAKVRVIPAAKIRDFLRGR